MVCGSYRLTKRHSVLILLFSVLAIAFFAKFAWNSDWNTSANESEICINGDCEERVPGERGGVQGKLNTVRDLYSQHLASESRNGYQASISDFHEPTGYLERDLHLCNLTAFPYREGASEQHHEVYTRLRALENFLPEIYLDKYKNPCWWSTLQPPPDVRSEITSVRSITTPYMPMRKTLSVLDRIFNKGRNKKETFTCLPAVYLAGFAKSGTTTLYSYLVSHPQLRKPAQKEGHFWRSLLNIPMNYTNKQMQAIWYMQHFSKAAQYIQTHPDAITIDASASTLWIANPLYGNDYFYDPKNKIRVIEPLNGAMYDNKQDLCFIPMAVHSVLPDAKFVVIMRDPVKRLFSDYWYFCANKNAWNDGKNIPKEYMDNAPQIFHNIISMAIEEHRKCLMDPTLDDQALTEFTCLRRASLGYQVKGSCFPVRLGVGMYYYHIVKWMNVYSQKNFHFLRLEDMAVDSYKSVREIWEFMGLTPIPKITFELETGEGVKNEMSWIKQPKLEERFYMSPETEKLLTSFYKPFNKKLARLLGNDAYLWTAS